MLKKDKLNKIAEKYGTPIYIYDDSIIKEKCKELKKNLEGINLYYACKANTNHEIVKLIYKQGFGIETVSPGEIAIACKAGVPVSKITFTCGSIDEEELVSVIKKGIRVHLDSLYQVEIFGKHFSKRKDLREISVRMNLMVGAGHHSHVITGGPDSKFGVDISQLQELKNLANKYNLKIVGLHQHIGSNILDVSTFVKGVKIILKNALLFGDLKHIDLGGGFGIPYKPEEKTLDIEILALKIKKEISKFTNKYGRSVEVSLEPGRYLVAEAGNLLVKVTDIKINSAKTFIGVNSGLNHLIRPAMYGSYHAIENLNNKSKKLEKVTIAGNICESGDVFAKDRMLAKSKIGDILAIKNVGAYGYVMSSNYNSRARPNEFMILGNKIKRI